MLRFFRKSLHGATIKILMIILVLTFVLWGIGDTLKSIGDSDSYAIKIGDMEYSASTWQEVLQQRKQAIRERYGKDFSDEELRKHGFANDVLQQFIARSLLSQEAQRLKLIVSDDIIKRELASYQEFKSPNGQFNHEAFTAFIKKSGLSENKVLQSLKSEIEANNLGQAFMLHTPVLQLIEQLNILQNITREVVLYTIDKSKVPAPIPPTDEQLQAVFGENKDKFSTPENREVSFFSFNKSNVDNNVALSDSELESIYKERTYLFTQPEKREVQQLILGTLEEAKDAKQQIEAGGDIKKIGKALKAKNKDVAMGTFTKETFDNDVGSAIFGIAEKKITEPIKTPLGFHIFQVLKIIPSHTEAFTEAKKRLAEMILKERIFERLYALSQQIDAEIASNKTIAEIAAAHGLNIKMINLTKTDTPVEAAKDLGDSEIFHTAVFATEQGRNSMVTPFDNETFFVVHVSKVSPKKSKPFETIRADLVKLWYQQQKDSTTFKITQEVAAALKSKAVVPEIYKDYLTIQNITVNKNSELYKILPQDAMVSLSQLSVGELSATYKDLNENDTIVKLERLILPNQKELEKTKFQARAVYMQSQADNTLAEYIRWLKERYKIKINKKLLQLEKTE